MTNEERKVIELALEALENSVDLVVEDAFNAEQLYGNYPTRQGKVGGLKVLAEQHKQAITVIKEALAQPEQEPVAWYDKDGVITANPIEFSQPLYTTSPQRKPLMDEQRKAISKGWQGRNWTVGDIIDAIEAAHGIKE